MDRLLARGVDEEAIAKELAETVEQIDTVAAAGCATAGRIKIVYMVACGAGYWIMTILQWWADTMATNIEFRTFTAADFRSLNLPKLDREDTLVILASKSGTTKETLEAAAMTRDKACETVVFTQSEAAPLAVYADQVFFIGQTCQAFHATFMLILAFVAGIWQEKEGREMLPGVLSSLRALPHVLAITAQRSDVRGAQIAARYVDGEEICFIAAGPGKATARAFGSCLIEEMLKLNVHIIEADHFFHSNVEMMTPTMPGQFLLIVTEDSSRMQMDRVVAFVEKWGGKADIYDSADFAMEGIEDELHCLFAPIVIEAALKPYAFKLAETTGRSFSERRYMGREEY